MSHPLAEAAGASGHQTDIVISVQGIGDRLDAELDGVDGLSLDETRALAHRVAAAHAATGHRAIAWRNAAVARLAARERELLAGTCEESHINVDDRTRMMPSAGTGSKAGRRERSFWERTGVPRHR